MNLASVLPLAFVMVAGPQFISAVFFATSEKWKGDSATFVAGAAISITAVYTAAYFIFKGAKQGGGSHSSSTAHVIDIVILVLLVFAAVYTFLRRKKAEPPKWMSKLQTASLRFSFNLGLLLLGVFPTDIATSVSVGAHLANKRSPWADGVPFILRSSFPDRQQHDAVGASATCARHEPPTDNREEDKVMSTEIEFIEGESISATEEYREVHERLLAAGWQRTMRVHAALNEVLSRVAWIEPYLHLQRSTACSAGRPHRGGNRSRAARCPRAPARLTRHSLHNAGRRRLAGHTPSQPCITAERPKVHR